MNFSNFSDKIKQIDTIKLGGQYSQFKLAPKLRLQFSEEKIAKSTPKKAAVLALFYPDKNNKTRFLLTQRASYNGAHSAQISFVGGKQDANETIKQTALRETFEEVGIAKNQIQIVRELTHNYIPPSNFMVTPFLGVMQKTPNFSPNYEVEKIIEVLMDDLLNEKNISSTILSTSYMKEIEVPCFKLNHKIVWGATAMILSEIKDLLKELL